MQASMDTGPVVDFMLDPLTNRPTFVLHLHGQREFKLRNHSDGPFAVVFEENFRNRSETEEIVYDSGDSNEIIIVVVGKEEYLRRIELAKVQAATSHKFTILINGICWDPRVIPD